MRPVRLEKVEFANRAMKDRFKTKKAKLLAVGVLQESTKMEKEKRLA